MSRSSALRRLQGQELCVIGSVQCRVVVNGLCAFFFSSRSVVFRLRWYSHTPWSRGAVRVHLCEVLWPVSSVQSVVRSAEVTAQLVSSWKISLVGAM